MNHTESIIVGIVALALLLLGVLNRRKNPELEHKAPPSTRNTPTRQTPMMAAYHDALHASGEHARRGARPEEPREFR